MTGSLLSPVCSVGTVAALLDANHYLGRARRGWAWSDEYGVCVFANPSSRRLPADWLELIRWCLRGEPNDGSRQWSLVSRFLRSEHAEVTTVVSYSDPSAGHSGALYRACNWIWAPTWHRLVPPPTGNGAWTDETRQSVKDRWIYPLQPDRRRADLLTLDDTYQRRFPEAVYVEPKRFSRRNSGSISKRADLSALRTAP